MKLTQLVMCLVFLFALTMPLVASGNGPPGDPPVIEQILNLQSPVEVITGVSGQAGMMEEVIQVPLSTNEIAGVVSAIMTDPFPGISWIIRTGSRVPDMRLKGGDGPLCPAHSYYLMA